MPKHLTETQAANVYAPKADPTFTGTVSGVTKSHVGLGNADNTSDVSKPISTIQQTALDLKAPKAAPVFTGTVEASTGDFEAATVGKSLVVKSPDGTRYRVTVANGGALSTVAI